jgi:hypothetical protein
VERLGKCKIVAADSHMKVRDDAIAAPINGDPANASGGGCRSRAASARDHQRAGVALSEQGMNGVERLFVGVAFARLGLLAALALMTLLGV